MSVNQYTEEFKREAVSQVKDRGYKAVDVANRLGIKVKTLSSWIRRYAQSNDGQLEITLRQLKAELARVTEERDILKKAAAYFAKDIK